MPDIDYYVKTPSEVTSQEQKMAGGAWDEIQLLSHCQDSNQHQTDKEPRSLTTEPSGQLWAI